MRTFLILTGFALFLAGGACRREQVASSTSAAPAPCNDPLRAQRLAETFGQLKNARLAMMGKHLEPLDGHVDWSLKTGEVETRIVAT